MFRHSQIQQQAGIARQGGDQLFVERNRLFEAAFRHQRFGALGDGGQIFRGRETVCQQQKRKGGQQSCPPFPALQSSYH